MLKRHGKKVVAEDRKKINRVVNSLTLVCLVIAAFLTAEILTYSNNNLLHNSKWVSGKFLLSSTIMGWQVGRTRHLFSRNQLNLAVWHPPNEILLRHPLPNLSKFSAKILLPELSYVDFIFNKDRQGFYGARFSNDPDFPSLIYQAKDDGEFIRKWPLDVKVPADLWTEAGISLTNGKLTIMNGSQTQTIDINIPTKPQLIGFENRFADVLVDDLMIQDTDERVVYEDNFRNDEHWLRIFFIALAALIVPILILAVFRLINHREFSLTATVPSVLIGLCATLLIIFCFDYFYWSNVYSYKKSEPLIVTRLPMSSVEVVREEFTKYLFTKITKTGEIFSQSEPAKSFLNRIGKIERSDVDVKLTYGDQTTIYWLAPEGKDALIVRQLETDKIFNQSIKILLIGTSQTWGTGAIKPEDRIGYRLKALIEKRDPGTRNVSILNISKRGSLSQELAKRYRDHYSKLDYDLIAINLGVNDKDTDALRSGILDILSLTDLKKTAVVFFLEASAIEEPHLRKNHDAIEHLASDFGMLVGDLYGFMKTKDLENIGLIWIDKVHFKSFGQKLAAEFMSDVIARQLSFNNTAIKHQMLPAKSICENC